MNINVLDGEQIAIHTYLKRIKEGVRVDIHVAPEVEQFFEHWGADKVDVQTVGRSWKAFPPGSTGKLMAWATPQLQADNGLPMPFDIHSLGRALKATDRGQNISFIRLIGASSPSGASFIYEDVLSRAGLDALAARIQQATTIFYDQYIRPAGANIYVSSRVMHQVE